MNIVLIYQQRGDYAESMSILNGHLHSSVNADNLNSVGQMDLTGDSQAGGRRKANKDWTDL